MKLSAKLLTKQISLPSRSQPQGAYLLNGSVQTLQFETEVWKGPHTVQIIFHAKINMVNISLFQWSKLGNALHESPTSQPHIWGAYAFRLHSLCKCHLVTSLPARSVPCKMLLLSWSKWEGRKVACSPEAQLPGSLPVPPTKWASDGLQQQVSWAQLLADRCVQITLIGTSCLGITAFQFLCGCMCATHGYLAGVRISSLIDYIPNLLSLPVFALQSNYSWKSVCNMRSSIFSSTAGKPCPGKKRETYLRNPDLFLYYAPQLSKCLLVDNLQFVLYQNIQNTHGSTWLNHISKVKRKNEKPTEDSVSYTYR